MNSTTSACAGHSGCTVWQQFIYATDYIKPGMAAMFIKYWLIDWGSFACPSGWTKEGTDCYKSSPLAAALDMPISQMDAATLFVVTATPGGNDQFRLEQTSEYTWVSQPDSVLDISSIWTDLEFNVFGDGGGSEAYFGSGTSVAISMEVLVSPDAWLTCVASSGTSGESNNLNIAPWCSAYIEVNTIGEFYFTESD